jgi:hypothetical protein
MGWRLDPNTVIVISETYAHISEKEERERQKDADK